MAIGSIYRCLLEAARERGVDVEQVLRDCALTRDTLFAADARLAPEAGRRLAATLIRRAGDPELGLRAAERIRLADLDLYGYLLWHSADLAALFEALARYAPLLGDTAAGTFTRSKSRLTISMGRSGGRLFLPEGADLAIGATARLVGEWSNGRACLREVRLARSKPRDTRRYERFFGVTVRFEAEIGTLVYDDPVQPIVRPDADPELGALLRRQADRALASLQPSASLIERTRALLGKDPGDGYSSLDEVATRLGMSERTLRRRLTEAGTSYRALIDDVRRERALTLAHEGVHGVMAIAMRSGFADVTAFARAFKRWTGVLPSDYLATVRAGMK